MKVIRNSYIDEQPTCLETINRIIGYNFHQEFVLKRERVIHSPFVQKVRFKYITTCVYQTRAIFTLFREPFDAAIINQQLTVTAGIRNMVANNNLPMVFLPLSFNLNNFKIKKSITIEYIHMIRSAFGHSKSNSSTRTKRFIFN